MGMREEIEALPDARTAAGTPIAGTVDRSEVFRIIDKHAATTGSAVVPGTRIAPAAVADRWLGGDSIAALAADFELSAEVVEAAIRKWADERTRQVVDMTPGMQPRPFVGLAEVSSRTLPRDAAAVLVQHAEELHVSGDGKQLRKDIGCHAGTDGDCYWTDCPQTVDGEPHESGRSCPLWNSAEDS